MSKQKSIWDWGTVAEETPQQTKGVIWNWGQDVNAPTPDPELERLNRKNRAQVEQQIAPQRESVFSQALKRSLGIKTPAIETVDFQDIIERAAISELVSNKEKDIIRSLPKPNVSFPQDVVAHNLEQNIKGNIAKQEAERVKERQRQIEVADNALMTPQEQAGKLIFEGVNNAVKGFLEPGAETVFNIKKTLDNPTDIGNYADVIIKGLEAGINLIPGVAALNVATPAVDKATRDIAKSVGINEDIASGIMHKALPFVFGKWVGLGSLSSEIVTAGIKESGVLEGLNEKNQQRVLELLHNGIFFGLAGLGGHLEKKGELPQQIKTETPTLPERLNTELMQRDINNLKEQLKKADRAEKPQIIKEINDLQKQLIDARTKNLINRGEVDEVINKRQKGVTQEKLPLELLKERQLREEPIVEKPKEIIPDAEKQTVDLPSLEEARIEPQKIVTKESFLESATPEDLVNAGVTKTKNNRYMIDGKFASKELVEERLKQYKEQQDAIQKPSTEEVDVGKPPEISEGVGKAYAKEEFTKEGEKEKVAQPLNRNYIQEQLDQFLKERGKEEPPQKIVEKDYRLSDLANTEQQKIKAFLDKYNITPIGAIQTSETDYGISHYFKVKNGITGEEIKVRVSDHPVENKYRLKEEEHLQLREKDFEMLEHLTNPERFNITEKEVGQGKNKFIAKEYSRKPEQPETKSAKQELTEENVETIKQQILQNQQAIKEKEIQKRQDALDKFTPFKKGKETVEEAVYRYKKLLWKYEDAKSDKWGRRLKTEENLTEEDIKNYTKWSNEDKEAVKRLEKDYPLLATQSGRELIEKTYNLIKKDIDVSVGEKYVLKAKPSTIDVGKQISDKFAEWAGQSGISFSEFKKELEQSKKGLKPAKIEEFLLKIQDKIDNEIGKGLINEKGWFQFNTLSGEYQISPRRALELIENKYFEKTKNRELFKFKITEEDYYNALQEIRRLQIEALNRLGSGLGGFSPELLKNYIKVGLYHFENGIKTFSEFSKRMLDDFGEKIKPYLLRIWIELKAYATGEKQLTSQGSLGMFGMGETKPRRQQIEERVAKDEKLTETIRNLILKKAEQSEFVEVIKKNSFRNPKDEAEFQKLNAKYQKELLGGERLTTDEKIKLDRLKPGVDINAFNFKALMLPHQIARQNPAVKAGYELVFEALRTSEMENMQLKKSFNTLIKEARNERGLLRLSKYDDPVIQALNGEKVELTPKEQVLVNEIRKFTELTKPVMTEGSTLKYYDLPHLQKKFFENWHYYGLAEAIKKKFEGVSPEVAENLIRDFTTTSGGVFNPYSLKRIGRNDPTMKLDRRLNAYIDVYTLKKNLDPILPGINRLNQALATMGMPNSAKWLRDYVDEISGYDFSKHKQIDKIVKAINTYNVWRFLAMNLKGATTNLVAGEFQNFTNQSLKEYLIGKERLMTPKGIRLLIERNIIDSGDAEAFVSARNKLFGGIKNLPTIGYKIGEDIIQGSFYLGSLTKGEWKTGKISPQRDRQILEAKAEIQGGYRKGMKMPFLRTTTGKGVMAFRRWLPAVINNKFEQAAASYKAIQSLTGKEQLTPREKRLAMGFVKTVAIGSALTYLAYNELLPEDVRNMAEEGLNDLIGYLNPKNIAFTLRTPIPAVNTAADLLVLLYLIVTGEEYKTTGKYGEQGDSKAIGKLKQLLPAKRFFNPEQEKTPPTIYDIEKELESTQEFKKNKLFEFE